MNKRKFSKFFTMACCCLFPLATQAEFSPASMQAGAMASIPTDAPGGGESIVEPSDHVADFDVRMELAKILVWDEDSAAEAQEHLEEMIKKQPDDAAANLLMVRYHLLYKRYALAEQLLEKIRKKYPDDIDKLAEISSLAALLGHAEFSQEAIFFALEKAQIAAISPCCMQQPHCMKEMYAQEEKRGENAQKPFDYAKVMDAYASSMQLWGESNRAECIYRAHLALHPKDTAILQKFAALLSSTQRYAEAEQLYLQLNYLDPTEENYSHLVRLKTTEKDYQKALQLVEEGIKRYAAGKDFMRAAAELQEKLHRYQAAAELHVKLIESAKENTKKVYHCCKAAYCYWKSGESDNAFEMLSQAKLIDRQAIYVQYLDFLFSGHCPSDMETWNGWQLFEWGSLLFEDHYIADAIKYYRAAIAFDNELLFAKQALAGVLSLEFDYRGAEKIINEFLAKNPQSDKFQLYLARLWSWSQCYRQSLDLYDELIACNPKNPVLLIEKARVALWSNRYKLSMGTYERFFCQPVDNLLVDFQIENPCFNDSVSTCGLYQGYESLLNDFPEDGTGSAINMQAGLAPYQHIFREKFLKKNVVEGKKHKEAAAKKNIPPVLELWAAYRLQKAAFLEKTAKSAYWNNRLLKASRYYPCALDFDPGNEEALFDYAQVWCSLGVCNCARKVYEDLLNIDPYHNVAQIALQRSYLAEQPKVIDGYNMWLENGRGGLSGITRHKLYWGLDYAFDCKTHGRVFHVLFDEHPYLHGGNYRAQAINVDYSRVVNERLSIALSYTDKVYRSWCLKNHMLGTAAAVYRCNDYWQATLGYERADEFYNYFGIIRGVQSDSVWSRLNLNANKRWLFDAFYRYVDYTDSNNMSLAVLTGSYQLTDYPRVIKFTLQGEWRNTAKLSEFIYIDDDLVNIIHPYWTPQRYYAARFLVDWRHDLQFIDFCGSEKVWYGIRLMVGSDTEHNAAFAMTTDWHVDFKNRWSAHLSSFMELSQQWDAVGIWSMLSYAF